MDLPFPYYFVMSVCTLHLPYTYICSETQIFITLNIRKISLGSGWKQHFELPPYTNMHTYLRFLIIREEKRKKWQKKDYKGIQKCFISLSNHLNFFPYFCTSFSFLLYTKVSLGCYYF